MEQLSAFGSLVPYWGFGLATAGAFYGGMLWVGTHFRKEFKDELAHWLNGYYESTWASQFCRLFDTIFGARHWSIKRFVRSAIASILGVLFFYILFAHVLGVLGTRVFGAIGLWQVLLVGAAVNIVADYISLVETRWLLGRFVRVDSVLGQLALLLGDLVLTAAIILLAIYGYSWLFMGGALPSPVEIVALFSIFSIFFYSTFLTSVWAWVYCLSTWFVRLFTRLGLRRLLDVQDNPIKQIALAGAAILLLGGMILGPALRPGEGGFATAFDDFVCSLDFKACIHAARAAGDSDLTVHYMQLACSTEKDDGNCAARLREYFAGNEALIASLWARACDGGYARACRAYGWMHRHGQGVAIDLDRAVVLYGQACDGGDMAGCINLGGMYEQGRDVVVDFGRAVSLYGQACDGGNMGGCTYLGTIYAQGRGVVVDFGRAVSLYGQACDGGDMAGCTNLGVMYAQGWGVVADFGRAVLLHGQACDGGDMRGCTNLGWMYAQGRGVVADFGRAVSLYGQACDGGEMWGCSNLGWMYARGRGVVVDLGRAVSLYGQACEGGSMWACSAKERLSEWLADGAKP